MKQKSLVVFCNAADHFAWIASSNGPVWDIFCHNASGTDNNIASYMNARADNGVAAEPYIITNGNFFAILIGRIAAWTRGTGPLVFYRGTLAQFVSPVERIYKCKDYAEKRENESNFSAQQPARALRMKLIKTIEGDLVGKRSPVLTRKIIIKFIIDCLIKRKLYVTMKMK